MTLTVSFHRPERADHRELPGSENDTLEFTGADGEYIALFVPAHVAAHTAAAFNRAMQAAPDRAGGWTYTTKSGVWHIHDAGKPFGFRAQHDDITGDNDPAWMFADARSLIGCMDEIDAVEAENACDVCCHLVGADALTEHDDSLLCDDCGKTEAERERGLREMADDDKAHAAREREMGL